MRIDRIIVDSRRIISGNDIRVSAYKYALIVSWGILGSIAAYTFMERELFYTVLGGMIGVVLPILFNRWL